MQKLIDKSVILGLCLIALSFVEIGWLYIVILLGAVAISSLCSYFDNKLSAFFCAGYVVLCFIVPQVTIFLPLIVYDCAERSVVPVRFCWVIALPACFMTDVLQAAIATTVCSGTALLLYYRTQSQVKVKGEYFAFMDSAIERADSLERVNRNLLEKQDYEVRLATLTERNRIAREIHDNVGHLLTRSLLQLKAMRVTRVSDEGLTLELDILKESLSDAMDSVRSSVHDLHDESVDLESRLNAMINGFKFCPVKLRFEADTLPTEVRLCFIAIVREALSNIARHSDATKAEIAIVEHPAFYQLRVSDNG
ncbi:MAG: histidine kinase, partial [Oscillospiraceae bacterium]|nr:histidine kinase [Oscillospiraceae bacterium]